MPTTILTAGTQAQLDADIVTANAASSGSFEIDVTSNITDARDLRPIELHTGGTLTIHGARPDSSSNAIEGAGHRGFFVYAGALTIEDLELVSMAAIGGARGGGGG